MAKRRGRPREVTNPVARTVNLSIPDYELAVKAGNGVGSAGIRLVLEWAESRFPNHRPPVARRATTDGEHTVFPCGCVFGDSHTATATRLGAGQISGGVREAFHLYRGFLSATRDEKTLPFACMLSPQQFAYLEALGDGDAGWGLDVLLRGVALL